MGRACVVADCHSKRLTANGFDSGSLKISHHEFPSEESVRREWIDAIRLRVRGGPERQATWMPSDMTTVCGLHFVDTDYIDHLGGGSANPRRRRLKPTAVPTVFDGRIPLPARETTDLQVLANQALKEQWNQRNVDDRDTEDVWKNCVLWSGLVPRYRRRHTDDDISEMTVTDDSGKVVTAPLDPTPTMNTIDVSQLASIEEVMGTDEKRSVVVAESKSETVQDKNTRLHRETTELKRKLSKAQLNLKFMEKVMKVKEVKKSRAMGRSYYYEKMCSKLRDELAALKKRHEEQLSFCSPPPIGDIEKQAAAGNVQAMFLMQQIRHFGKGDRARPQWEDAVLEKCASWLNKSHFSYRYVKRLGLVLLPSRSTLSRFADWKATTVTTDGSEPSIPDHRNEPTNKAIPDDSGVEPSEQRQEQVLSVKMIDASGDRLAINDVETRILDIGSESMDMLNRLTDATEVTIITLDPTTRVFELRVDASPTTTQEIIEMTTTSEPQAIT